MSSRSESAQVCRLLVRAIEPLTEIYIVNDRRQRVAALDKPAYGELTAELSPGRYKVCFTAGTAVHDEWIHISPDDLGRDVPVVAGTLPLSAIAPLPETRTYLPKQADAANYLSRAQHVKTGHGGEIFLFARSLLDVPTNPIGDLLLLDLSGQILVDCSKEAVHVTDRHCAGCNVHVNPGNYRLRWAGKHNVQCEQVLTVLRDWQTQVFLLTGGPEEDTGLCGLNMADMAIFFAPVSEGFVPTRRGLRTCEHAHYVLAHRLPVNITTICRAMQESDVANHPMLAMHLAPLLLMQGIDVEKCPVLHQSLLERKEQPDACIMLLAAEKFSNKANPGPKFEIPPMLTASWTLLVNATLSHNGLVETGCLADRICEARWSSGVWLSWEPQSLGCSTPVEEAEGKSALAKTFDWMDSLCLPDLTNAIESSRKPLNPLERDFLYFAFNSVRGMEDPVAGLVKGLEIPVCTVYRTASSLRQKLVPIPAEAGTQTGTVNTSATSELKESPKPSLKNREQHELPAVIVESESEMSWKAPQQCLSAIYRSNAPVTPNDSAPRPLENADLSLLSDPQLSEELRARIRAKVADLHSSSMREGHGLPSNRELAESLASNLWGSGFVELERSQRLYFYEAAAAEILALYQKLADASTQGMAQDATVEETRKLWRKQLECRQRLDDTLLRPYVLLRDAGRSLHEIAELLSIPQGKVESMLKLAIYKVEMAA